MHTLDDRLRDAQGSIDAFARLLLEKHNNSGFIQEQATHEVVTHTPELR
jgi:hypothetical protein